MKWTQTRHQLLLQRISYNSNNPHSFSRARGAAVLPPPSLEATEEATPTVPCTSRVHLRQLA